MLKATIKYLTRGWRRNMLIQQIHKVNSCGFGFNNSTVSMYNSKGLASRKPYMFQ